MNGLVASAEFWIGISLFVLAYEAYAVILVCRASAYSRSQKVAQVAMVLLLPLLGAVIAHWFATHGVSPLPQADRQFEPREVDGA